MKEISLNKARRLCRIAFKHGVYNLSEAEFKEWLNEKVR